MTSVSLSDLKAKRAAMQYDGSTELLIENAIANRNATGIVATHNAADVLIEIAEAALAYEQAKIDAAVIRYTYATADDRSTVGAQRIEAHDRDEIRCRDAYRAALAKIKP